MNDRLINLHRKGNRALVNRDYQQSEEIFRELVERFPDSPKGYIGLAKVFERVDRHEDIVEVVEPIYDQFESQQLLRILGDACRVLANRGEACFVDRAIRYYDLYLESRRDSVVLFYQADLLEKKKKDYTKALERYRASWDSEPKSRNAYLGILRCLNHLGMNSEIEQVKSRWERSRCKDS